MRLPFFLLLIATSCTAPLKLESAPTITGRAAVVSISKDASDIGAQIMLNGGNAVDAAVATAFALAVTFPEAGNIGGGGFMLIHFPDAREPVVVDYRETAPAAVDATTFFKKQDRRPHRLAGVPGTVRGLALAHQKYGKLPWRDLILSAIALARDGFALNQDNADSLNRVLAAHQNNQELQRVFAKPAAGRWSAGERLIQPDLAKTLQLIADAGPDAFYTGTIADQIVAEMKRGNGLITRDDLAAYKSQIRKPIHGTFRGYDVYAPPPPSSGGVALVEMLNILENFPLARSDRYSPLTLHLITEAMRRAYADRGKFLGDPAFTPLPPHLTDKEYATNRALRIDINKATPSLDLADDLTITDEPQNTTHFSVVDPSGMAVANTYTLEESYGGKIVVPGAGFLLNNELGDFNPQPRVTTRTGQIGTPPNLAGPGKRPLSSMCPTIVARDGKVIMVTGSPGGRTIINTVLCVVLNRLEFRMTPREAVDAPRHHHAWLPDRIQIEPLPTTSRDRTLDGLRARGHTIDPDVKRQGDAHTIMFDEKDKTWIGVADQRRSGAAAGY